MDFPPAFLQNQIDLNGERGLQWIERLPEIISACERRWHITAGEPFGLSMNYAAPATHDDGTPMVLKIIAPYLDADNEYLVLQHYAGHGAIRLIERDESTSAMLLERCLPGDELATLFPEGDDEASAIAGDVMARLWHPLPASHPFPTLLEWTGVMDRIGTIWNGGLPPMDKHIIDAALSLRKELLGSMPDTVLLHGDFHHHNVLRAQREPWLVIDPKGVAGEKAYEPATLFPNPVGNWHGSIADGAAFVRRRAEIICERAGLDLQRVLAWAVVHGVVSDAWTYESGVLADGGAEVTAHWALEAIKI
jgi:streptomycin 6-kinase